MMDREMIEKAALMEAASAVSPHLWPNFTLNPDVDDIHAASQRALGVADKVIKAYLSALNEAGYVVVPREPTEAMIELGRDEMPVEVHYWQEGRFIHAQPKCQSDCVNPATVYTAMLTAAQGDGTDG